jgi:hypothetical protein
MEDVGLRVENGGCRITSEYGNQLFASLVYKLIFLGRFVVRSGHTCRKDDALSEGKVL